VTVFGWDASHYDGPLVLADMVKAHDEGIEFFTHKLGEGLGGEDPTQGTALAAARDAGITVIGGYWFCHNDDDPLAEARACVATADRDEPWWRTFPCWFWQPDCETEAGHGKPTRGWIETFADELDRLTGRPSVVYASRGQYGQVLTGLGHMLWNASYPSSAQKPFKELYPGDHYAGWNPYSGQTPVLCQYASSATIAGHTTCDANAFRGTVDDLYQLLGGAVTGTPVTTDDIISETDQVNAVWRTEAMANMRDVFGGGSQKGQPVPFTGQLKSIASSISSLGSTVGSLGSTVVSGFSTVMSALSVLGSKIDKIPTTAVEAAPLSDADVLRIADAVVDRLSARTAPVVTIP
jgi:GH25 family lysozyme M1 (1,4-beta-N-acetylmuramidase)